VIVVVEVTGWIDVETMYVVLLEQVGQALGTVL